VCRQDEEIAPKRQLTIRAVATGLCVGSILCFSNTYFGLQTGWVTMGSLQSAILGFGVFRVLHCFDCMKGFTVEENVIVQTTSVATATMPLAAGNTCITVDSLVHYIKQHLHHTLMQIFENIPNITLQSCNTLQSCSTFAPPLCY